MKKLIILSLALQLSSIFARSVTDLIASDQIVLQQRGNDLILRLGNKNITSLDGLNNITQAQKITRISLQKNKITEIPSKAFYNFPNLYWINLDSNDINFIAEDAFVGLNNLQFLSLHNNPNLSKLTLEFIKKTLNNQLSKRDHGLKAVAFA